MFAGEGDAFRTNRRFHLLADGMPAKRLSTAFDSVTLYGNDPDRASRHLRQGRQLRRVDRDARRHEGAVLGLRPLRAEQLGVDDDQRPGADDPRDVHEHRDRPAARQVRAGQRPRADRRRGGEDPRVDALHRARHRAGRHPEGGPGPEHLHLLDRVQPQGDGRHPAVLRPSQRAEFLLGVDLRLSHRRGRARIRSRSSRSRWPTASRSSRRISRAACTSTISRRTCRSSSATAWTRSTR